MPKDCTYVFDFVCAIEGYFGLGRAIVAIRCRHVYLRNGQKLTVVIGGVG
jgi:hypothetical protein